MNTGVLTGPCGKIKVAARARIFVVLSLHILNCRAGEFAVVMEEEEEEEDDDEEKDGDDNNDDILQKRSLN